MERELKSAAKTDDFTRRLLDIHTSVRSHVIQPIQCVILRSDYMLHQLDDAAPQIKQVEINTISCSFSGLGPRVSKLHSFVVREFPSVFSSGSVPSPHELEHHIVHNKADEGSAETLAAAWTLYGNAEAVVMFLVQSGERNKYDQLHLQYLLGDRKVPVIRCEFQNLSKRIHLSEDAKLFVKDAQDRLREVALVYFRSGYTPNDYKRWGVFFFFFSMVGFLLLGRLVMTTGQQGKRSR